MRKQVTRTEAMKLIGKNIVAVKKDGTRVTGKLLKVSGNKLVLKRLGGKKYVPKPSCLWYYLICWPLRPYLTLMAKARDLDQGMVQVRNLIVAQGTALVMDLDRVTAQAQDMVLMVPDRDRLDFSKSD